MNKQSKQYKYSQQDKKINKEQVRTKAYELAEKRGFIPGHELDDWLEAEKNAKSVV